MDMGVFIQISIVILSFHSKANDDSNVPILLLQFVRSSFVVAMAFPLRRKEIHGEIGGALALTETYYDKKSYKENTLLRNNKNWLQHIGNGLNRLGNILTTSITLTIFVWMVVLSLLHPT